MIEVYETIGYFVLGCLGVMLLTKIAKCFLRDYFAAKAMQSILVGIECAPDDVKNVVESAYVLADAMLAARKKK